MVTPMKIDDMERGEKYTIRYRTGDEVKDFDGCRFEGLGFLEFPGGEENIAQKVVAARRDHSAPLPILFNEEDIVEIVPE